MVTVREREAERKQWRRLAVGLERQVGRFSGRLRILPEAVADVYHRAWSRGIAIDTFRPRGAPK